MHRSVVDGGFAPDVLHYVDLTALRPVYAVDIGAEHPKGRPHSLPFGKFDACFDLAVLDFVFPLSLQPRGRVLARRRLASFDDQIPGTIEIGIFARIGVVLEFLVAPTACAGVVNPLGGIRSGTSGPVKFVCPDKPPIGVLREGATGEKRRAGN